MAPTADATNEASVRCAKMMIHAIHAALLGLQMNVASVPLAVKVGVICDQLGIDDAGLTVPAALKACNAAMGIGQTGPLIGQTDALVEQLGLSFDALAPLQPEQNAAVEADTQSADKNEASTGAESMPVHAVMSAPAMVHKFSSEAVPDEVFARAMACQFWAPNHKLKGSWRFVQLGAESRLQAARLSAQQAAGTKADARFESLRDIPGCCAVLCKAFYESADRLDKEEQRALMAVHNVALGFTSQGLGIKWVTGAVSEIYELWELVGLEPNEEVLVGLLWYGWPAPNGIKPVKDTTAPSDKLCRLP